jgi:hypothetical protein
MPTMPRRILFEFDGFADRVPATLLDEVEPGVCEEVWTVLETPLKMWPWHTTSTGCYFSGKGRPPRQPERLGSQAAPRHGTRGRPLFLCQLEPGSICYAGAREMSFAYGEDITEPLPAKGPVVAKVASQDLETFYRAGLHVWNAQYRTHRLVLITARRAEA